ncbi:hypothetical protein J7W19_08440 [Streptomyces mobaraensis NBRC 13819 = DSM 40847]|uniref:Uncharacterized protein n=1 Tax=Streptomyces mobaraensis (strain ATCC 29032 / DSM 40847 / JCM 4168 / NBRC 13819 / NCIMB 11159 / IPCR 16-22) TaxID=1223523 RepID=M3C316_STRM1|nr:hypothetical protein [Streptomyces mobaraensis]EME98351.1 hypothetical protein H340_21821 [Streptomyces mobaraensis NBRC 13819 = DSM 40847]QTT73447.1 hypothetical protein J7W19_08440 [Streptomyces mobaraensis NBRC 13819 = DSM 40847]
MEQSKAAYRPGAWLTDTRRGKVGQVTGHWGPKVRLRPPGGGREWEAEPGRVRPATLEERERAGVPGWAFAVTGGNREDDA